MPTVQVQGPPAPSSQATSTPSLIRLYCVIEGEGLVFGVDISAQDNVSDLKKKIQIERAKSILRDTDPHSLELWKVSIMDE